LGFWVEIQETSRILALRQDQGIMAVAKHFAYNEQDDYR